MEDHHDQSREPNSSRHGSERSEPVRSRWSPKPEQILILESIFNSGMVNPPKEETVRIRKLLEKFGSVGDANVFYWFQNRRSRSRRRQRQLQAQQQEVLGGGGGCGGGGSGAIQYENNTGGGGMMFGNSHPTSYVVDYSSSSCSFGDENVISATSAQMGFQEIGHGSSVTTVFCPSQSGFMTVFINGVPTEVPRETFDMKAMFGTQDAMLVHSSGIPLPMDEFGFLLQSLQPGESYFLVSRPT